MFDSPYIGDFGASVWKAPLRVLEVLFVNGPGRVRHRRFFLLLAPLLLGSIAIPAGRSDATQAAPSAADVVAGLKAIQHSASDVADSAGKDNAKALKSSDEIESSWKTIQDVVRANDNESYLTFENAIQALAAATKAGDAKKAGGTAGALTSAVNFYVAKYPATATAAAPAAASSATTAPAARAANAAPGSAQASAAEAAAPAPATATNPAPAKAPAQAPAAEAGGTLARTGPTSAVLAALAGLALALGGLALIGGARRRLSVDGLSRSSDANRSCPPPDRRPDLVYNR